MTSHIFKANVKSSNFNKKVPCSNKVTPEMTKLNKMLKSTHCLYNTKSEIGEQMCLQLLWLKVFSAIDFETPFILIPVVKCS